MLDKKTTAVAIAIQLFDICTYIVGNCKIFLKKKTKKQTNKGYISGLKSKLIINYLWQESGWSGGDREWVQKVKISCIYYVIYSLFESASK